LLSNLDGGSKDFKKTGELGILEEPMSSTITKPLPQEKSLQDSMLRLEAAILAPVVSGELKQWAEVVAESLQTFGATWVEFVNSVLHQQYVQIAKTDPDLLSRVDQMIQADRNMLADFGNFKTKVDDLAVRARQAQKNEAKLTEDRTQVEKEGMDLIIRIKKQQAAATTWLNEANYRDLGTGD
jgi:hypothetical protein